MGVYAIAEDGMIYAEVPEYRNDYLHGAYPARCIKKELVVVWGVFSMVGRDAGGGGICWVAAVDNVVIVVDYMLC